LISDTATRVNENTTAAANDAIRRHTEERVCYYASGGRDAIDLRLQELDREWDIERALEAQAAGVTLAALALGVVKGRKWFLVPAGVAAFLLQHALQGWCPPLSLLRRLGFRTESEINCERYALKALRGDFGEVQPAADEHFHEKAAAALRAVDQ
jgi:hypothetical protein